MEEPIISLKNLTKQYDGKTVVDNINLDIKKGEFVTFLGPSGCGKTTTLRMIAGFEMPTSGEVLFNGENIENVPPHKRNVNTVFQKYALFPHYNVFNNVAFGLKLKRIDKEVTVKEHMAIRFSFRLKKTVETTDADGNIITKSVFAPKLSIKRELVPEHTEMRKAKLDKKVIQQKVMHALKIVGLSDYEKRDVTSLSGGQQQRVAIARAIVNEPEILLLDEPLGALDLKMRQEMQLELKKMHKILGITFIYVTHDQEEALTMSDTIVVMRDGLIMQEGSPTDIYNDPINAYVADFIGESNIFNGVMKEDELVSFGGLDFKCVDTGFMPSEDIDVVIRPEDIILAEPDKGLFNGIITNSMFRGVHYEMTAKALGLEFIIHSTVEQKVGSEVSLYIKPYDFHIMRKEQHTNELEAKFYDNETVIIGGEKYAIDPTKLFNGYYFDDEHILRDNNAEEVTLDNKRAILNVAFTDIELMDNENDSPLAGNVYSMIYKGKNYLVTIRVSEEIDIYADTEYLWDDGDRVGISIAPDKFSFERWIDEE